MYFIHNPSGFLRAFNQLRWLKPPQEAHCSQFPEIVLYLVLTWLKVLVRHFEVTKCRKFSVWEQELSSKEVLNVGVCECVSVCMNFAHSCVHSCLYISTSKRSRSVQVKNLVFHVLNFFLFIFYWLVKWNKPDTGNAALGRNRLVLCFCYVLLLSVTLGLLLVEEHSR